ncbi:TolC family protein [Ignavibacteriales bacterium]
MSLEECIKYGLENNKGIKIASDKVKSARLKKDEVNTSGLPSLSLQAGYTRLSEVDPFTITVPMGGTTQSFTVSPSLLNSYSAKLTLTQPVFTGFKIDLNKDLSDQTITASMFDLEAEKSKLRYSISNAYWSLYKVLEGKKVIDEYIKTIQLHLKDLNNFYNQGLITKNEVLKLEVQLSSTQVQLLETENGIQLAKLNLLNNLNLPMETDISLKPLITPDELKDIPSLDEINTQALNTRPELKAMSIRIKSRETAVKLTESAWYPDIYLIGNYNYARPNQRIVPTKDQFDGTWDVTLSLQYTLWNWNATSYRTQQAESDLSQTNYQFEMMKDGVLIEVKQAYLNYIANKSRIALAEKTVTQAEENYRISYNLFQKGLIRNSDLIDAEVAVFESKIKLVTSISDLRNAEALLNKAIGI